VIQIDEAMGQNPKKVAEVYDAVAMEYAEKFCGEHEEKPQDREMLYRFSQEVAGRKPIWDFGCGPGQTTQYLRKLGIEISGLDLSEKLIEQARIIHPGIIFRKGNILDLEFENASIAGVVAFYAIVHFSHDQLQMAFREIFRVLQPGSVFLFTFHIGEESIHLEEFLGKVGEIDFMFFKTEYILICIRDAGFVDIDIIERAPYPKSEAGGRKWAKLAGPGWNA
jgi:ubiquinone/menaquinone biosynthesis C-methylase UbiE